MAYPLLARSTATATAAVAVASSSSSSCSRHALYQRALESTRIPLVISTGPAGTSKTMTPCVVGARRLVDRTYERMVLTRPTVSVGNESLGFLPGDLHEKMAPWVAHMTDILDANQLRFVQTRVDTMPLGYLRGHTWKDRFVIADEMQNSTPLQMKTLLTRVGANTKLVITGDLTQSDQNAKENGLVDLLRRLEAYDQEDDDEDTLFAHVAFTEDDVLRSAFVKRILRLYRDDDDDHDDDDISW